jgi:hypothetical protein
MFPPYKKWHKANAINVKSFSEIPRSANGKVNTMLKSIIFSKSSSFFTFFHPALDYL